MNNFIRFPILFIISGLLVFIVYLFLSDTTPNKINVNKELFPYQSQYLQLDNRGRLHYIDEGTGPTLLLLHGNPTWSFLYRDIIAELKNDYRLIVPDYPGFGLSTAPPGYTFTADEQAKVINELVQKLDMHNITIMVQDWGGPIGFDVALNNPERIKAFVIGNTWAWPLERKGHKVFSTLMGGWPGQFTSWCCNGIVRFFMSLGVVNKLSDDEYTMYLSPFKDREHRSQTHIFPAQLWDAEAFLSNLEKNLPNLSNRPALLVWGMQDFAFKEPERLRFEAIFPNHKTILLENAGHFIQEDASKEIAIAIRNWQKQQVQE
jgi:haloalkane dehalogenase